MALARLEVTDALGSRTVAIESDRFQIGRRSSHDLHLTGSDVSRDHAEIERRGDRFTLRDRGSQSGTFVNGEPITERVLEEGDRIHVGRNSGADLVFHVEQSRISATPTAGADLHQIAGLLDGLRALGSGRVVDEVLALVLDSAISVTGASRGFVMLADAAGHLEFKLGRARKGVTLPGHTFQTSQKIPEEVFATGEARVVADLLDAELADGHLGTIALGIRHVLCVPLTLVHYVDRPGESDQAKRIGVLYLDGQDKGALLSPDTWHALGTLAAEAAQAIENARLYRDSLDKARLEQQMKVGAEIQQALFPKAGHSGDGFEVACASLPCLTIGGDFFDYLDLPGNQFGFVLGDVSGKGLPAALLTALLQGIFATEAGLGRSPADAMERANNTLMRKALQARYATVFYGILAPGGQLTYTNAGHNAPLLVRDSGIERLKTGGTILGAFPDATFEQGIVTLSPGDLVVVFSDGVTEAFAGEWEEFGEERLIECVRNNAALAPRALLDQVMAAVRAFTGDSPQSDDQTVLVLRYTGA